MKVVNSEKPKSMSARYRRFFSHYTFIYPDLYLKNVVVELDNTGRIVSVFPFDREIEDTEFYSGKIYFVPEGISITDYANIPEERFRLIEDTIKLSDDRSLSVYDDKGLKL